MTKALSLGLHPNLIAWLANFFNEYRQAWTFHPYKPSVTACRH